MRTAISKHVAKGWPTVAILQSAASVVGIKKRKESKEREDETVITKAARVPIFVDGLECREEL